MEKYEVNLIYLVIKAWINYFMIEINELKFGKTTNRIHDHLRDWTKRLNTRAAVHESSANYKI